MPAVGMMISQPAEAARARLRDALVEHFHAQPAAAPSGYPSWPPPAVHAKLPGPLPVPGDPVVLMENLKILRQYARLLTQACHFHHQHQEAAQPPLAHAQPLSTAPPSYQRNLEWFAPLAIPYAGISEAGSARVEQLLQLYQAASRDKPLSSRELAFQLAKSLPHYDRDLTASYLLPSPPEREIDLCVAHSILRLHDPPDPEALQRLLATWRNQGLLHVLSVAALHMPTLADWFPPSENRDEDGAVSLLLALQALRAHPRDYARTIADFIDTQDPATPTAQAIATTLDRLAVLMSVRSDAATEPEHHLAPLLAAFPCLDALEPHDLWRRLKSALVRSLPPSLLRVDPACARKRVRQAPGTWSRPPLEFELLPADASPSGLPRLRIRPAASLHYQPYTADCALTPPAHNPRLHEILARLGEICLSTELAGIMLMPGPHDDPRQALLAMDDDTILTSLPNHPSRATLAAFLADSLPPPALKTLATPLRLCAWRVDAPGRVCLFTGDHPQALDITPGSFAPHTLSKTLLDERSRRQDPSAIHLLLPSQDPGHPASVRASLLHHAQTALTPHRARVPGAPLDTTLEEAFACLVHAPDRNHTDIALHQSPPWDKDHVDSR